MTITQRPADLTLTPLFEMHYGLVGPTSFGQTPLGVRARAATADGTFEGKDIRGKVLPGGVDWILGHANGVMQMDVHMTLQTDDGVLIHARWDGYMIGSRETILSINDPQRRAKLDPASYYMRTLVRFEVGGDKYAWLNKVACVGTACYTELGIFYKIYRLN